MTVRELVTKFGLGLDRTSFDQADARVEKLKRAALAVGAAFAGSKIVRWGQRMVDATAQAGDQLGILSARTGIGVEALQELQHAAAVAGVSTEEANASLQVFTRTIGLAANGNKAASQAFARLGVSIRDASGRVRSGDDVMMDLADGLARLPSDAHRANAAMALMGRGGIRMAAALKGGSAALAEARQEARELGLMSEDTAKAAGDMVVNQIRLRRSLTALRDQIVGRLLPAMNETVPRILAWMKANKDLIAQRVEQAVRVITAAMVGLSNIGSAVVEVVRRIRDALGDTAAAGVKLGIIVGALVALFGLKAVAIGLVVALFEDMIGTFQGKDSVLRRLAERLREIYDGFMARDFSWKDHPYLRFLQELFHGFEKVAQAWARLPFPLRAALSQIPGLGVLNIVAPAAASVNERNDAAKGWAAQGLDAQREAFLRGHPGQASVPPTVRPSTAALGAIMSVAPQVNQTLHVQIDGSGLDGAELQSRIERAVGKANREAFTAAVPAIAGSGW